MCEGRDSGSPGATLLGTPAYPSAPSTLTPVPLLARLLLFNHEVACDPMDCSTPGFPVLHYLLELAQTPVHWVSDAIQPSHPLPPLSPPALNLSQHHGLFFILDFHFSLSCVGEGNGDPLQCSCLENPRDGRAWWAAIYGVTQSRTWLKWLSSSSIAD